jgi:predicted transcriptional regulator
VATSQCEAGRLGYTATKRNHHVAPGNWVREHRGIYWVSLFPPPEHSRVAGGSSSPDTRCWRRGSMMKSAISGGAKVKNVGKPTEKTSPRVTVSSGSVEAFVGRSLARARRLDRGERLAPEITMTFEDPADLVRVLSAERVRVIHAVREKPAPVSELAVTLRRDRKAVKRDVSLLESFGLVNAREEVNPGHGRRRIIEPLAAKYQLIATI